MACSGPLIGFLSKVVNPSGKRSIVFNIKEAHSPRHIPIPCGKCHGCRMAHARNWAVRVMHEARMHKVNSYVTLTYDNDHLPENGFLTRRDTQLFMKRLRKVRPSGSVRVYGSGEYGDLNKRPHYHMILFGVEFPDQKFFKEVKGVKYYTSVELRDLWFLGNHLIGPVNYESALYVAGYVHKKVDGKMREEGHYEVYDSDGVVHERPPEFAIHSRGSAIGKSYYEKYGQSVRDHDTVIVNGKEVPPPRLYDILTGLTDPDRLDKIKSRRKRLALSMKADNTSRRRRVKELVSMARMKKRRL